MTARALLCSLLAAIFLVSGCAHKLAATGTNDTQNEAKIDVLPAFWSGRISLQIQSEPVQAFFAGFELRGQADNGELTLISPLGSILGVMRWTPLDATLEQGGNIRRFLSADELLVQTTGAAVPVATLFDWLSGKNTTTPGWAADLSQQGAGRITAQRTEPMPPASLRIVLDKP